MASKSKTVTGSLKYSAPKPPADYLSHLYKTPLNVGTVNDNGVTFKDYQTKKVSYNPADTKKKKYPAVNYYVREDQAAKFPKGGKNTGNPRPGGAIPESFFKSLPRKKKATAKPKFTMSGSVTQKKLSTPRGKAIARKFSEASRGKA